VPEPGIKHGRGIYEMVSGRENLSYLNAPGEVPEWLCRSTGSFPAG